MTLSNNINDNMQDKIYVYMTKDNKAILQYPKYNIVTNAYIGRNGLARHKKEGDGKTPIGEFSLGIMLGIDANIKNKNGLDYIQINKNMYWVDDFKSKYYNQLVNILKVQKDWHSAEHLIDYPIQYQYLLEIKTNPLNIPNKGSAIFLHCTNYNPTAGCVAIDKYMMRIIMQNVDKSTKISIGT